MSIIRGESESQGYLGFLNGMTGTAYTTVQTLVTNDASQSKTVTSIIVFNYHTSAVTFNLYYLPNNAGAVRTPASEDQYKIWEVSIAASDTEVFDIPVQLNATNDTLRCYASTTAVVNAVAFGYEATD